VVVTSNEGRERVLECPQAGEADVERSQGVEEERLDGEEGLVEDGGL